MLLKIKIFGDGEIMKKIRDVLASLYTVKRRLGQFAYLLYPLAIGLVCHQIPAY